ncbi:MAG: molybdenum cofactor biosynthesis protein A [Methanosaeta sp. PtaU1.Bin060]|nr:MAG: molybdenum cofactor biosynthesis protein A [Methanosaeta sp. PtaU1.Bin060]
MQLPFNPIHRAHEVEALVMQGEARRYYRFRQAPFYGGIITADASGCNILCGYCWNIEKNSSIEKCTDRFYAPAQVATKLRALMAKHGVRQYRISGCEPLLGEASAKHLGAIVSALKGRCIIETNGIALGHDPTLLAHIPKKDVHFRITIKADSAKQFERITGAKASAYKFQLEAIRALEGQKRPYILALMHQFVSMEALGDRIDEAGIEISDCLLATDVEGLQYYPQNTKSMRARGLAVLYEKKARDAILAEAKKNK